MKILRTWVHPSLQLLAAGINITAVGKRGATTLDKIYVKLKCSGSSILTRSLDCEISAASHKGIDKWS